MPALGISDSGNLFGALEFSETLAGAGIQPIIGMALPIHLERTAESSGNGPVDPDGHLALLAKNEVGYVNLVKLSSSAFLETDVSLDPHIALSALRMHSDGLICLTGGPGGPVNKLLVAGQQAEGESVLTQLKDIFGDRLYVELQRHGLEEEIAAEGPLVEWPMNMSSHWWPRTRLILPLLTSLSPPMH